MQGILSILGADRWNQYGWPEHQQEDMREAEVDAEARDRQTSRKAGGGGRGGAEEERPVLIKTRIHHRLSSGKNCKMVVFPNFYIN